MSRAAAIVGIGAGLALLFVATQSSAATKAPEFNSADLALFLDSAGYLNFDQAFKPAVNSDNGGFLGDIGLAGAPAGLRGVGAFDWGSWAYESEWGLQSVLPDSLPIENDIEVESMNVSDLILNVAEHLMVTEGFRPYIYDDVNGKPWSESKRGNPTIGYGHLVTKADLANYGWEWTMDESGAYALLLSDINAHLSPVVPYVKVPLTMNQWIVITSLAFGSGPKLVINSNFLRLVNAGDLAGAEAHFKDWNKATIVENGVKVKRPVRGLTLRREREWTMFTTPQPVVMLA